ncbi:MAG: DNA-binding protein [Myxococcota bacterium]|nr:DNA-binding protein [Myxococcota bacterium]
MTRVVLCLVLLMGCDESPPPAAPPSPGLTEPVAAEPVAAEPAAHPSPQPAASDAVAHSGIAGEVLSSGGYTYVRIDASGEQLWVAGLQADITVGQAVEAGQGSLMQNFESKTLGRTFEAIQFVPWVRVAGGEAAPAPAFAPASAPASAPAPAAAPVEALAGGQTVAQLFAEKTALANQPIAVRGRVTKVTAGVMGTTFMHLQDGTGSEADGTHDLTVTTDDPVAVGQTVVVRGTLITDKDFGAGYRYDVLIENATLEE